MRDTEAASPLTVILTVALVVAGATALLFFTFVDIAGPQVRIQQIEMGGGPAFEVSDVKGSLSWQDLQVRFLTPGGADQGEFFLEVPAGDVDVGDHIRLRSMPPSGTYILEIARNGEIHGRITAVL